MCNAGIRIRLCKGAYQEPADKAFPLKKDVDANYVKLAQIMLDAAAVNPDLYPAFATHDKNMITPIKEYAAQKISRARRLNFRCCTAFAVNCNTRSPPKVTTSAFMCRMVRSGIRTSCAAWRSDRRICGSLLNFWDFDHLWVKNRFLVGGSFYFDFLVFFLLLNKYFF